jgi:hypothetical protein
MRDNLDVTFMSRLRETLDPPRATGTFWKASAYRLGERFDRSQPEQVLGWRQVEADPGATWTRHDPFGSYRSPDGARREGEPGPHSAFLALGRLAREADPRTDRAFEYFASRYGLLGLFRRHYLETPVFADPRRHVVAPEAVVDDRGRLRRIDAATEGVALLTAADPESLRLLPERDWGRYEPVRDETIVALPSEVYFPRTGAGGALHPLPEPSRELVPWERMRRDFGGLLVYDGDSPTRVSVLCTSEPLNLWRSRLADFPAGSQGSASEFERTLAELSRAHPDKPEDVLRADLEEAATERTVEVLRSELAGAQPYPLVGEDGRMKQGWLVGDLLQAMHLMLYLDETGGWELRKCQAPGCPNYFRASKSSDRGMYCPPPPGRKQSKCVSRLTSQMHRDRRRS